MFKQLLHYFKPHKKIFFIDMICAVSVAVIDISFPLASRFCMYTLLPKNIYSLFFIIIFSFIFFYILRSCCYYVMTYIGHTFGVRVEADIRADLFYHLQKQDFEFYDSNRTGMLMSRITNDLFDITELTHHGPEDLTIAVLTISGALVCMFAIEWELALLIAFLLPIFILTVMAKRKKMSSASKEVKRKLGSINSTIESAISGVKTSKAFANEGFERERFDRSNERFKTAKSNYYKAMGEFNAGMEFFLCALPCVVIGFGGYLIMKGRMNYIDLITFTLFITTFVTPIRKLSNFAEIFASGMAGFSRFIDLMSVDMIIPEKEDAVRLTEIEGEISIENISFNYGESKHYLGDSSNDLEANEENPAENSSEVDVRDGEKVTKECDGNVLKNVSLHVPAGTSLALVGESGGGKSTLCQLIPRFYDVKNGSIKIDGVNIKDVTKHSLRENIGFLQQDVFIFADTIAENIRYGNPNATKEEIEYAAKRAEIYDVIMQMPNKFDTYVGERGMKLSGGQKQRLAIARIFLRDPKILILDEATSALDTITEKRIQKSFDELMEERTSIVIAHRLSTIRKVDKIAVMERGRVMEYGSHDELIEHGGRYAELYEAQSMDDKDLDKV